MKILKALRIMLLYTPCYAPGVMLLQHFHTSKGHVLLHVKFHCCEVENLVMILACLEDFLKALSWNNLEQILPISVR